MAVVPEDLLTIADELLETAEALPDLPRREALCRAAISRAYYAAYHHALRRAQRRGFSGTKPGYGSHEALWLGWYAEEENSEEIAAEGSDLRDERVRADYRLRETSSPVVARSIVGNARSLIRRIDAR